MTRDVKKHGFTLIEVMVSIAILGVIMTLVWSSTSQSLNSKDRIEKRDLVFHEGGMLLRKMTEDISMAFLLKAPAQAQPTASGIQEPAESDKGFKAFFIAEDNGTRDSLRFTSLSHMRLFGGAKESDQCKISYELRESKEQGGHLDVVRMEEAWLDDNTEVKGNPQVISEGIRELNMEYYDVKKNEWVKDWDSEKIDDKGKLPVAVKVIVVFADPVNEDEKIELSTAVLLPLSGGPINF